jgi:hypothetical protein
MSVQYGAIGWNRQKKVYDLILLSLLALYLGIFVGVGTWRNPSVTAETLLIRAFGTAAFLLLNVVLCIGGWIAAFFRCSLTAGTWASLRFCWAWRMEGLD